MFLKKKKPFILVFSLLFVLSISACSDNGTGVDPDPDNGTDGPAATIQGSVDESSQGKAKTAESSVEGTVVYAATVNSSGSVEMIDGTETDADASGEFSINVDASISDHFVIVAETSSGEAKGFISAEIENDQSYTIKPLDEESTAQTSVFAEVVADGQADVVQKSDIELAVRAESSAEINADASVAAEVAAAVSQSAEARAEFVAEAESEASLSQAHEVIADLQFQLETNIDGASSDDEKRAAFDAFVEAKVNAYAEAGMEMSNVAKMLHLEAEIKQEAMSSVSAEVQNTSRATASYAAAIAIDTTVLASAEASGASNETISAVADAGVSLRAELEGSSGASAEVEAAFETYHQEVRAAFESDASVEAAVIVAVDTEVRANGGAKATFESALNDILGLQSYADIYAEFSGDVESTVESQMEVIGDVDAELVTEIVVLINLFS